MDDKNDIELYKSFLNGNNEAFDEIIKKYRKKLILFINKYVRDIEIAEDISQETFIYILINRKEYDFKYSLKTYLYTIAKCRSINYIKKYKKIVNFDEDYMTDIQIEMDLDENLIKEENKKQVFKAISKLKVEYQTAIILKDFENFKYEEMCKILNKNMPQIKILIYRARKSLKNVIEKEGMVC